MNTPTELTRNQVTAFLADLKKPGNPNVAMRRGWAAALCEHYLATTVAPKVEAVARVFAPYDDLKAYCVELEAKLADAKKSADTFFDQSRRLQHELNTAPSVPLGGAVAESADVKNERLRFAISFALSDKSSKSLSYQAYATLRAALAPNVVSPPLGETTAIADIVVNNQVDREQVGRAMNAFLSRFRGKVEIGDELPAAMLAALRASAGGEKG